MIKFYFVIFLIVIAVFTLNNNVAFCGNSAVQERTARELTKSLKAEGFYDTSCKSIGQDTISIRQGNVIQNDRLTEGQLVNVFNVYLTPNVVSKLKKAGFKRGIFIDGKERKYPFDISTKYYHQMQEVFKKMSGGR